MWFGVLGRLEVRRADGSLLSVPGPARRRLLAALLCRCGAVVSSRTLLNDLWGAAAPRSATNSLHSHVARLRDDLGREQAGVLVTVGDGYRLVVQADDIDANRFQRLSDEAGQQSDPRCALELYDAALALWRDDAYTEFGDAAFAVGERVRLAELRALARERRTDVALAAGLAKDAIGDLEERVRAEPYRERGWEQLAVALYCSGRQGEALAACRRVRTLLVEDLGVEPGPGLREVEFRILRQDGALLSTSEHRPLPLTPWRGRCPYLGLSGYEGADAAVFVGRERLTSVLAGRLSDESVLVLIGASGVGKSSLVRAGLLPALRAGALPGSAAWRVEVRTPRDGLETATAGARPADLLVLDQAEELFTTIDPLARDAAASLLDRYVDEGGRLVMVLRSDLYGRLAEIETLAPYAQKTVVLVGPMRDDELRRALVEPAAAAGVRLEDELLETIMDDVAGQSDPLPLLSQAMVRTWQGRQGDLLTVEAYRLSGELSGALEAAAEECYTMLDEDHRRAARHLLVRMAVRTPSGWLRRPITLTGVQPASFETGALEALITARLVVASEQRVEITHDALLVHWPRLREWLEERGLAAELVEHLDRAASAWRASGRQAADLYRGPRLTAATDWRVEHPEDVSLAEQEFLDASALAADAELDAALAQAAREAHGRRTLRRVALALGGVVVLAGAGAGVALHERGTARSDAKRAEAADLVADARRLSVLSADAPDIATASLLAVAAYRLQDSNDTRGALLTAAERGQSALWRLPFDHRPQRIAAAPDGSFLAVADNRPAVVVVDPRTRRRISSFPASGFVEGVTADSRQVVTFGQTSAAPARLSAYDVSTGREHLISTAGDTDTPEPVVTSDGRWVCLVTTPASGSDVVVDVFDSRSWAAAPRQFATAAPVALAAGGSRVALESADGSVEIRQLPSLQVTGRLPAAPASGHATGIALSPDGSHLARVDPADATRASIYDLVRAGTGLPLPAQSGDIGEMEFSPDNAELAVGSLAGPLAVYRSTDAAQTATYAGHAGPLVGVTWTGSSHPTGLYTVGLDSELVSWALAAGPRNVDESGPDVAPIAGLWDGGVFGPLLVGNARDPAQPKSTSRFFTVDMRTGAYASWPIGVRDDERVEQVVASSDGRYGLVSITGTADAVGGMTRIEIVDLHTHRGLGHLQLPDPTPFADGYVAAISPDGSRAYSQVGRTRIGVFAVPSGRLLSTFPVLFSGPDGGRLEVDPIEFDPAGRLVLLGYDPPPGTAPWAASYPPLPVQNRLGLLDVSADRLVAQTVLPGQAASALAWSHDGRTVAVGTLDGTLNLYDAHTLALRESGGVVSPGFVVTASFSPDDTSLAVGGTDGALDFLSLPGLARVGQRILIGNSGNNGGVWAWYTPHGDVEGLAQDPRHEDSELQRWFHLTAAPEELAARACQLADADISPTQWAELVGDQPYRHVCSAPQ